jgi:hypothetical protein
VRCCVAPAGTQQDLGIRETSPRTHTCVPPGCGHVDTARHPRPCGYRRRPSEFARGWRRAWIVAGLTHTGTWSWLAGAGRSPASVRSEGDQPTARRHRTSRAEAVDLGDLCGPVGVRGDLLRRGRVGGVGAGCRLDRRSFRSAACADRFGCGSGGGFPCDGATAKQAAALVVLIGVSSIAQSPSSRRRPRRYRPSCPRKSSYAGGSPAPLLLPRAAAAHAFRHTW